MPSHCSILEYHQLTMRLDLAEALLASDSDPNFLPCPRITLYGDCPTTLGLCGICQDNKLEVLSQNQSPALAILPCAHIACIDCLEKCLQNKAKCPFCRFELRYELCCHPLQARVITKENLLSIPDTVPVGGIIPDQCQTCRLATNASANEDILRSLAEVFQSLREQYKIAGSAKKDSIKRKVDIIQRQFQMVSGQLSAETTALLGSRW